MNLKIVLSAIVFGATSLSSAVAGDERIAQCMANAPDPSEEFCTCMVDSIDASASLEAELEEYGGMPPIEEQSEELKETVQTCRA